ncbi:MAG: Flp pilus assembly complex ATPase component TadA [Burkholderiales bacterium]|nr:Flp pilus assembly complex ATPase component TadA [Burkholderiales bacterium]
MDKIFPGRSDRGVSTTGHGDAISLVRSSVQREDHAVDAVDAAEGPTLTLAVVNRPQVQVQVASEEHLLVANGGPTLGSRRAPQRGVMVEAVTDPVIRDVTPVKEATDRGVRSHASAIEDVRAHFPAWKGECLEGVVAAELGRSMAVLWLGLGDVAVIGSSDALSSAHAAAVRERLRSELHMHVCDDYVAPAAVVGAVVDTALAAVAHARAGKPSRETYQLVIYDEIVEAAVRARASDIHFSLRKAPHNTAMLGLRMFGRYRVWRTEMSALLVKGVLGAGFGRRLIPGTNSKPTLHFDSEIAFMTDNPVEGVKWVGRCNGRPSVRGYKLVERLLESDPDPSSIPTLEQLGYIESHCKLLRLAIQRNYGVVVIFGSTGSGKSTTLRTFMVVESDPTQEVSYAVESPSEYELPGVESFSIPVDVNMSSEELAHKFRAVLRDAMRMDPDKLMVGEIRDHETAVLMSEFTKSDHRCYTTAHGSGAADGLSRLCGEEIRMPAETVGGDRFISASIYQRLLPKLCPTCKLPASGPRGLPKEKLDVIRRKFQLDPGTMFVARAEGCSECVPTVPGLTADGTKGVTVAAEVLIPDTSMRELIAARDWPGLTRAWRQTRRSGFGDPDMVGKTAFECALYLAARGLISPVDLERDFEPFESYEVLPAASEPRGGVH